MIAIVKLLLAQMEEEQNSWQENWLRIYIIRFNLYNIFSNPRNIKSNWEFTLESNSPEV